MSPWQLKRQLAWWLGQQAFAETPQGLVLVGGSFVTEDEPGNFRPGNREVDGPVAVGLMTDGGFQPFAVVSSDDLDWDGESMARLESALLRARIVAGGGPGSAGTAAVAGIDPGSKGNTSAAGYDTHGLNQVTGTLRASPNGQGQAQGRDVDELLARVGELVGETGFVDSIHGLQGRLVRSGPMDPVFGVQVLDREVLVEVLNGTMSNAYPTVFRPAVAKVPSTQFTFAGATLTGYTFTVTIDATPTVFSAISGATTEAAAVALATAINADAIASKVFAVAVRGVVTVGPITSSSLTTLTGSVTPGGTGGQASAANSTKSALLTWIGGAIRFDSIDHMIRRGAASGNAAPSTPAAGVGVLVNGRDLMPTEVKTIDHNAGSGTWNYSLMPLYSETPGGWPTVTVLGLSLAGYTITVYTTGGNWTITVPIGASLAATATAIAAALNAHPNASLYATATANGAVVTLQPIGNPAWLGVSIQPGGTPSQLDRSIGDRFARSTLQLVIA